MKDEDVLAYRIILRLDYTHFDDLLQIVDGMLEK